MRQTGKSCKLAAVVDEIVFIFSHGELVGRRCGWLVGEEKKKM